MSSLTIRLDTETENQLAEKVTISSISEVRERALISESGNYLNDDEYEQEMDAFFRSELGLIR